MGGGGKLKVLINAAIPIPPLRSPYADDYPWNYFFHWFIFQCHRLQYLLKNLLAKS